jgi:adenylate cyclase
MSDVFISYARSTAVQAKRIAEALRGLGYGVWRDDELPAHRDYSEVIEERLRSAKAVVVVWSSEAVKSQWVRAEADLAREAGTLVQLTLDGAALPMPFNRIQCADMADWSGDLAAPGWRKVAASVGELVGGVAAPTLGEAGPNLPPPLPDKPSIAVMPFANLSGDPEQEYFADGMVEEIVGALARYKSIFVIGSGSTFSFKGRAVSTQDVGHQLGVRYVLEGSVRRAANRVRIAVKLTDASDGAQIWADRFDDTLEDVFALQDKVALSVAGAIEPTIQQADIRRASKRPTENMGSYDLYLRAQATTASSKPQDLLAALELLKKAIDLDPGFGPALATAAKINAVLSLLTGERAAHRENGLSLIQRALQVAGDDPAVIGAVAEAGAILGRDTAASAATIDRALALNPGSALLWSISGRLRVIMGELDVAVQHIETGLRLDPLSSSRFEQLADLGCARLLQKRFDEALVLFQQSIELRPAFPPCRAWLASALGHLGRIGEAREALERFQAFGVGTLEQFADRRFRTPAGRTLFLDGIAAARSNSPGPPQAESAQGREVLVRRQESVITTEPNLGLSAVRGSGRSRRSPKFNA